MIHESFEISKVEPLAALELEVPHEAPNLVPIVGTTNVA